MSADMFWGFLMGGSFVSIIWGVEIWNAMRRGKE